MPERLRLEVPVPALGEVVETPNSGSISHGSLEKAIWCETESSADGQHHTDVVLAALHGGLDRLASGLVDSASQTERWENYSDHEMRMTLRGSGVDLFHHCRRT